jgi:farnesyl-diphosphate farnesyltransferase
MNSGTDVSIGELRRGILRGVSRSFYLSISILPARLRRPIALAYLLARATDSVADTSEVPVSERLEMLPLLASVIQGEISPDVITRLVNSFAPQQSNRNERRLIEALPNCIEELQHLEPADRNDVRTLLCKITKGQSLDLTQFGDLAEPQALPTAIELHEYTYLVAGCVGEFWTNLCFRHIQNFSAQPEAEMLELGRRYGSGLQLINILRDAHRDLQNGRCYFPMTELQQIGVEPGEIVLQSGRFEIVFEKWREEAQRGVTAGMNYVHAIRSRRIRGATALPALIGARTLALLHAAGPSVLHRNIKVPRSEVRAMLWRVASTFASTDALNRTFLEALG